MDYHFKNLVFEGGGVKGIAYVGALEALDELGILQNITRVGGTSVGAVSALLLGLGYTTDEMTDVLYGLDFRNFMDDNWGIIRDTQRLINEYGWYKGKFLRRWIGRLVERKTGNPNATFVDVFSRCKEDFREMYFTGTNLSTHYCEVFSWEHTPRMCVADAVRISMSIPLFFTAVQVGPRDDVYVDGGVLRNYPIKLFDRRKYGSNVRNTDYYDKRNQQLLDESQNVSDYAYNKDTLGFRLDSAEEIATFRDHAEPQVHEITDLFSYIYALIETVIDAQSNAHLHSDDWQRTIYVDTLGVKTTEFDLAPEKKKALVESGRKGVKDYFKWYDNNRSVNDLYGEH